MHLQVPPRKSGPRKDVTVKKFGVATKGLKLYSAMLPSVKLTADQKLAAATRAKARQQWLKTPEGQVYRSALTAAKRAKHAVLAANNMYETRTVSVLDKKPGNKPAAKRKPRIVKKAAASAPVIDF